jgi:hypothetical protein
MKRYILSVAGAAVVLTACKQNIESASESFNELPPAVQRTVRMESPNGEIQRIAHSDRDGLHLYTVELRENGQTEKKLVVAANGQLLTPPPMPVAATDNRPLTPTGAAGTPFSALPLAAQKTILSHAPQSQVTTITRQDENGRVIYEVAFADEGKNPTLRVAEDGALVQTLRK